MLVSLQCRSGRYGCSRRRRPTMYLRKGYLCGDPGIVWYLDLSTSKIGQVAKGQKKMGGGMRLASIPTAVTCVRIQLYIYIYAPWIKL